MHHVMIVEDEVIVRMWLKKMVNWESLGLKVVVEASNGNEAFQLYKQFRPQVILTDLRMPIMGGIELIREIRKTDKATRFIILTCLNDFEIAKEAINLNVSGYVLKLSSEVDEIERELKKVTDELKSNEVALLNAPWVDQTAIVEQIVRDFVIYQKMTVDAFIHSIKMFPVKLEPNNIQIIMIRLCDYERILQDQNDLRGNYVHGIVIDILQKTIDSYIGGNAFHDYKADFLILTCFSGIDKDKIDTITDDLQAAFCVNIRNRFNCRVLIGISDVSDGYESLPELRQQALDSINNYDKNFPIKLSSALDYINNHFNEDLSLQSVADQVGITPNYLGHLFQRYEGTSFSEKLNGIRMERAKELLSNPAYKISKIAREVGFFNTTYFYRLFKNYTGLTPTQYRTGRATNE